MEGGGGRKKEKKEGAEGKEGQGWPRMAKDEAMKDYKGT